MFQDEAPITTHLPEGMLLQVENREMLRLLRKHKKCLLCTCRKTELHCGKEFPTLKEIARNRSILQSGGSV